MKAELIEREPNPDYSLPIEQRIEAERAKIEGQITELADTSHSNPRKLVELANALKKLETTPVSYFATNDALELFQQVKDNPAVPTRVRELILSAAEVCPEKRELLRQELEADSPSRRKTAINQLTQDPEALELVASMRFDLVRNVAGSAIEALGSFQESTPILLDLVTNSSVSLEHKKIALIQLTGREEAREVLKNTLLYGEKELREHSAAALAELKHSGSILIEALRKLPGRVKVEIIGLLARREEAQKELSNIAFAESEATIVRAEAIKSLNGTHAQKHAEKICKLLEDTEDPFIAMSCCSALGEIPGSSPTLMKAFKTRGAKVKASVIRSLGKQADGAEFLEELLTVHECNQIYASAAADVLKDSVGGRDALERVLNDCEIAENRLAAIVALTKLGVSSSWAAQHITNEKNMVIAERLLEHIPIDEQGAKLLLKVAVDSNSHLTVRCAAIRRLGEVAGSQDLLSSFALKDNPKMAGSNLLAENALLALGKIRGGEETLKKVIESEKSEKTVVNAISGLQDSPRALEILEPVLNNKSYSTQVRHYAALVLALSKLKPEERGRVVPGQVRLMFEAYAVPARRGLDERLGKIPELGTLLRCAFDEINLEDL